VNAGALPDTPLYALLPTTVDAVATIGTAPLAPGGYFKVALGTR
jgi:hypothetical protein